MLNGKRILLIVAGGIAAFKSLELIRRLRERGASVRCVLTDAGASFVTPLSLQALSEDRVYSDMFSLTDESEMGHIQLSRDADLLVVAPATANILARMAAGLADDLAATVLLATDKPVLAAPAMNVRMWTHAATVANVETLKKRGVTFVGPNDGAMACNEYGPGRMSEPEEIVAAIEGLLTAAERPLAGKRAVVTSGPTREAIDPVRYISNHSSGKQGHAIASALARLGAEVTLVSGPVAIADPPGAAHRPCRIRPTRCWRPASPRGQRRHRRLRRRRRRLEGGRVRPRPRSRRRPGAAPPALELAPNPDILATLSRPGPKRPALVVGFAAETENLVANAIDKRKRKGCDWIVANDVSAAAGTFGGERNTVHLISAAGVEDWPTLAKGDVAMAAGRPHRPAFRPTAQGRGSRVE